MREKPALVSFGLGGHTVHYYSERTATGSTQCRTQGYESPESFERRMQAPEPAPFKRIEGMQGRLL